MRIRFFGRESGTAETRGWPGAAAISSGDRYAVLETMA